MVLVEVKPKVCPNCGREVVSTGGKRYYCPVCKKEFEDVPVANIVFDQPSYFRKPYKI